MAASTTIGMLVGAIVFGYITDRVGRKLLYMWDMIIFVVFTAAISLSFDYWFLFVVRLILGLAIGADYAISATIIAEFAPKQSRGKLLMANGLAWWVGSAIAFIIGYLLLPLGMNAWRWMFAIGIIPALIVLILRRSVPESARWLANAGQIESAKAVEKEISGRSDELKVTPQKVSIGTLFSKKYARATAFVALFWFSYDVAFYGISLFSPTILSIFGLSHAGAILGSAIFAVVAVIGSLLGIATIDSWGRKAVTILGFAGMTASLLVLSIIAIDTPKEAFAVGGLAIVIVIMYILFELTQTWGPGCTDFVFPQELFPTSVRATAQGWGTSVSRIGAILGLVGFPQIVAAAGLGYGLVLFLVFSFIGLLATIFLGIETGGKSLEEITE
jgi:putative MFS transporter